MEAFKALKAMHGLCQFEGGGGKFQALDLFTCMRAGRIQANVPLRLERNV